MMFKKFANYLDDIAEQMVAEVAWVYPHDYRAHDKVHSQAVFVKRIARFIRFISGN